MRRVLREYKEISREIEVFWYLISLKIKIKQSQSKKDKKVKKTLNPALKAINISAAVSTNAHKLWPQGGLR